MSKILLLAEDREDDVFFMERAIQRKQLPCILRAVTDGEQVLDYLEGKGDFADRHVFPLPSLVLLDIKMPKVDGFEALRRIRANRELARLPVVMFSTSKYQKEIDLAYDLFASGYMVKPSNPDELDAVLEPLIRFWFECNNLPSLNGEQAARIG
jgi:CheY-like chemotaxis protein